MGHRNKKALMKRAWNF